MRNKKLLGGVMLGALTLVTLGAVPIAQPAPPPPSGMRGKIPTPATSADLGGAERYLTMVSTDKPIYRANEKVYVRAILLDAATHKPLAYEKQAVAQIQVVGPKGEIVSTSSSQSQDSVVGFAWTVPESAAGGEYTLKINYPQQGYAPAERKFDVRIYRAPRLRSQITFVREGYGAGDKVFASLHTERAEGGLPAGAAVTITALVDGKEVFAGAGKVDAKGDCAASFDLPKAMERGDGTLAFAISDGGTVETAAKTIPILLQTLDVAFYPEGGDPVAGLDTRFYLEAKTPNQKPADLVGEIIDSKGRRVAEVKTEHEGRARFDFVPRKGETYSLKVSEPAGIAKTFPLPVAKESGVTLQSLADVALADKPVRLRVAATDAGAYKVALMRHENAVAEPVVLDLAAGKSADAEFKVDAAVDGVLTATVWDAQGMPLAERLIYRAPLHSINVTIKPALPTYTPGANASVSVLTTDENGEPVSAMVGLTVTDDSVLELIDKREQAPRLPVMALLEPEVRDLADAHVYLDAKNPKAPLATDLLLGTQGWRRFALENVSEFLSKHGDDGARVLALVKPEPPMPVAAPFAFGGGGFGGGEAGGGGGRGGRGGAMPRAAAAVPADAAAAAAPEGAMRDEFKAVVVNGAVAELAQNKMAVDRAPADNEPLDAGGRGGRGGRGGGGGGGGAGGGGGGGFGGRGAAMDQLQARRQHAGMIVIREFAHTLRPGWSPTERADFSETLFWNAGVQTDGRGMATVSFALSDSVTTFRVNADSFDKNGALGTGTNTMQAVQPFFIEPKLPLEVTTGDVIDLPVSAKNNTTSDLQHFSISLGGLGGTIVRDSESNNGPGGLAAMQSVRKHYLFTVSDKTSDINLAIQATAGEFTDNVTRPLRVRPTGFPTQISYGGLLDSQSSVKKEFVIPESLVPQSMQTAITVYSSPMANLTDAVAALLREPCGCFEQTSSSNYPLAMAQQYFMGHQGMDPVLISKSNDLLTKGYQRLIGFECQEKGYEWFGGAAPGHEALTAYGLMEFRDMQQAQLPGMDGQMIERTRAWLMARRDGKGGFLRNARSLDTFGGAPELTTNAYIVWALQRAGEKNLDMEIAAVLKGAQSSDDSYLLALAANVAQWAKEDATAKSFMEKLVRRQDKEGAVDGGVASITRSGGAALAIETTALASLTWMGDRQYAANAQRAIEFLADSCKGGRFGSTQSTILALKAITAYDAATAHPKAPGQVAMLVDGKAFGAPLSFTVDSNEPLKFADVAPALSPGKHSIALQMADGSQMPFSMAINFNSTTPASDDHCKLRLETWLKDAKITEGGITETRVVVSNPTAGDAASPVAIIGIPGGLEVRHDQLKELVKAGKIDAYEVNGREVVLYWRQIKANAKADISLSLLAAIPGTYSAPASRVYEYYTDEYKEWVAGTKVGIAEK